MLAAVCAVSGYGRSMGSNAAAAFFVTSTQQFVDGPHGGRHVGQGHDPLVDIPIHGLTGQAQLQGPIRQSVQPQRSLRIPLDPYRTDLQLARPGLMVAVTGQVKVAQTGMRSPNRSGTSSTETTA